MKIKNPISRLTRFEKTLWIVSVSVVLLSFILGSDRASLPLAASLIGVTGLIFIARGDVLGQVLTIVFSLIYGVISIQNRYYGEMMTYVFMSAPMAIMAIVSWVKNPYRKNQVRIAELSGKQIGLMSLLAVVVTAAFYFILEYFNTANTVPSTISVTTSFVACYLTFCRSPYYALGYAANDVVLIVLWVLASVKDPSCIPMIACFVMFLANDLYGFFNWRKMMKAQRKDTLSEETVS